MTLIGLAQAGEAVVVAERALLELSRSSEGDRLLAAILERFLSFLYAMAGRFDEARDALRTSGPVLDDMRHDTNVWIYSWAAAGARELLGDYAGAERELRARRASFEEFRGQAIDALAMQSRACSRCSTPNSAAGTRRRSALRMAALCRRGLFPP